MEAEEKNQLIKQYEKQLADQLAAKDNTITILITRITALEGQIANQCTALESLNANFAILNQQTLKANQSNSLNKRKRLAVTNPSTNDASTNITNSIADPVNVSNTITDSNLNNVTEHMDDGSVQLNQTFASVTSKKSRPMPLQLGAINKDTLKLLFQQLNTKFHADSFDIFQLNGNSTPKIYPANAEIKSQIIDILQSNQLEFNSFAEKGEKQQSFIVRGLNIGDDESNIKHITQALTSVGIQSDVECNRFITSHMKRSSEQNPNQSTLYRFTINHQETTAGLSSIKTINGFRVVIEKMKKSAVIQCRRCQRFQHTANSCSFNYRCVQCVTPHNPGQCPRTLNKKLPLQCCNCSAAGLKKSDHTANNVMECEYFKTKHSTLFNKLNHTNRSIPISHPLANSSINDTLTSATSNRSRQEKVQTTQTLQTPALNPYNSKNRNNRNKHSNVHTSKSHVNDRQPEKDNDKFRAFTNALIQLINGFSNVN